MDLFDLDEFSDLGELLSDQISKGINASTIKITNLTDLAHVYEDLLAASDKNDFANILNKFRETASEENKAKVDELIDMLNSNDYSANDWVTEWTNGLADVLNDLGATVKEIQTFKDELREKVVFKAVKDAIEALDTLNSRLSAMSNIINNDWVQDENGLTDYGRAKILLLSQEAQNAQQIVANAAQKIQLVQDEIAKGFGADGSYANEEEARKALTEAWTEYSSALQNVYSIDNEIYELSKKQQEAELTRLNKVVDAYKKALANKKSYWEYSRNIQNQTKEVEAIKAQIEALNGVTLLPLLF